MKTNISLTEVVVSDLAVKRVEAVLRSGRIGQGQVIEEFEHRFAEWIGSKYAIAVSSGTMADTIALAILKNFYPNQKKVIFPAHTFAAQLNAVIYNGLTPVFYDDGNDEAIKRFEYDENDEYLCWFPVHLLGMKAKTSISNKYPIIEDACEAMGSEWKGKKLGTLGDIGTFSFFPSHTMTTGEGGMVVTNNFEYAEFAKKLRNHGKNSGKDFHFDVVGFNGKMTSIQAALGIEALKTVDADIAQRRSNYLFLGGKESDDLCISPHAVPVFCKSELERDALMKKLNDNGVECRNFFSSLPTQENAYRMFGHKLGDFPIAERAGECGLYVPCHQYLRPWELVLIKEIINGVQKETEEAEEIV